MRSDRGRPHVVVVGGGFSGITLAVHLREAGIDVTIVERTAGVAKGLAYGTSEPRHLLNVRAGSMSALPASPRHFADWLVQRGAGDTASFAPRTTYARYLSDLFVNAAPGASIVHAEAVECAGGGLRFSDGQTLNADAVVIAAGNILPEPSRTFDGSGARFLNEPWSTAAQQVLADAAKQPRDVLLIGTGLTAVDAVLSLDAHSFGGRIIALSRRGLLPRAHAGAPLPSVEPVPAGSPRDMLRALRRQAGAGEWRGSVDALRPVTAEIWGGWSQAQRGGFLRHLRPWWDVHRHRIAPEVAERLAALMAGGRLVVAAGRIVDIDGEAVRVRYRGRRDEARVETGVVVNCTGPQGDLRRSRDPLLVDLLRSGAARTDAFGLGLDVDAQCRVVGADGRVTPGLYAIGPMTKGTFWETVAVPDIRRQAAEIAATLADDLAMQTRLAS